MFTKEKLYDFVGEEFYKKYLFTEFNLLDFQIDFIYKKDIELTIKYIHIKHPKELLTNYLYINIEEYKNYIIKDRIKKIEKIRNGIKHQ